MTRTSKMKELRVAYAAADDELHEATVAERRLRIAGKTVEAAAAAMVRDEKLRIADDLSKAIRDARA